LVLKKPPGGRRDAKKSRKALRISEEVIKLILIYVAAYSALIFAKYGYFCLMMNERAKLEFII